MKFVLIPILAATVSLFANAQSQRTLSQEELIGCLNSTNETLGFRSGPQHIQRAPDDHFIFTKQEEHGGGLERGFFRYTPTGILHCVLNWPKKVYFKFMYQGEEMMYATSDGTGADGKAGSPKGSKLSPQNPGEATNCRASDSITESGLFNLRKQIAANAGRMAKTGKYKDAQGVYKKMGKVCRTVDYVGNEVEAAFSKDPELGKQTAQ